MNYDFDQVIDRRTSDSSKWNLYEADVLPLWTADMDFKSPQPVIEALHARIEHGVFGYCMEPAELREVVAERMMKLYNWRISPEWIVFQPGVITGFTRACRLAASPGDGVLVQSPVFEPIYAAPGQNQLVRNEAELTRLPDGSYEIDFQAFEEAITDRTRVFILCNPHNPVGRVFTSSELEKMADICLRNNVLICSDEIHSDLIYQGYRHVPIASLDKEISKNTITFISPSKTYNLPGLRCSIAIVSDDKLRNMLQESASPHFPEVNTLGFTAALVAYRDCQDWLDNVLHYLEANRDMVFDFIEKNLPGVTMHKAEGLYLAWLDCREVPIQGSPYSFFLDQARVALTDGAAFGTGGAGFVRFNYAIPRSILVEALNRMKKAVESIH
jgi:cysteine-S-conjugate beta-lyase